jgi:hypothetical protein
MYTCPIPNGFPDRAKIENLEMLSITGHAMSKTSLNTTVGGSNYSGRGRNGLAGHTLTKVLLYFESLFKGIEVRFETSLNNS